MEGIFFFLIFVTEQVTCFIRGVGDKYSYYSNVHAQNIPK